MKSDLRSSVGNFLTPRAAEEPSGSKLATQKQHTGSFTEHLHSAETKRLQRKAPSKSDVPVSPEVSTRATNISLAKGAKHAKPTHSFKLERSPDLAHGFSASRDPDPKVKTDSATHSPASAEAEETESLPDSETPQTTLADQIMLAVPLVIFPPPPIQPPSGPLIAPGDAPLATAVSAEVSSGQPIEALIPPSSTRCEVADEKDVSAPALNLEEQVKPDEQMETLAGDAGESGQGESQEHKGKSHLDSLTPLSASSDEQVDGTSAAKQQLPMTNMVEMEESAGPAVKNLPGTESALEVPAARIISRVQEAREERRDFQIDPAVSQFSASNTLSSGATTTTTSVSDVPAVERVARAVMEGVAQMRHTGNESVSVVLKPDSGTELLLRVEMRDGALSAQLHFERGDRGALDQHWDELQRRLAEQGVRLSRADDAGMGGNAQFAQSQRRTFVPDEDSMANASSTFTKKTSSNQTATRQNARGFETWA